MRQGAQGWCTGMTQRDGMGREVEGGLNMGNTCTPMADSCECMAKPLQYCKVIINMYDPITVFLIVWGLFSIDMAFPSLAFYLEKFL